ncbi:MAG: hypothetical protein ACP5KN_13130 [Armatimonadota bacterium]
MLPECSRRREFNGFHVCTAADGIAVVTSTDCGRCPVPETLERVDCIFLHPRVRFTPVPEVRWVCAITDDWVDESDPTDCSSCFSCKSIEHAPDPDHQTRLAGA